MLPYGLPGVTTSKRGARVLGLAVAVLTVAAVVGWRTAADDPARDPGTDNGASAIEVTLVTDSVGAGVVTGTEVRRAGVKVGTVTRIERGATGQEIRLTLDPASTAGLTSSLSIDFAPANLFGITQITLKPADGGAALEDGEQIDLTGADRVFDATTSALMTSFGSLTDEVLTDELSDLIARLARDSAAFSPILRVVVTTAQAVAQTQKMPYSPILQGLGDGMDGLSSTLHGGLVLLDTVYSQPYLKSAANRERFDQTVAVSGEALIPSLAHLLETLEPDYRSLANLPVPLLDAVADSVGTAQSGEDLTELLERVDRAFADSPAGPILRVALAIDGPRTVAGGSTRRQNGGPR